MISSGDGRRFGYTKDMRYIRSVAISISGQEFLNAHMYMISISIVKPLIPCSATISARDRRSRLAPACIKRYDLSNQHVRDPILSSFQLTTRSRPARDTITSSSRSRSASNPSATQHQRSARDPHLIGGPFNTSEVKVTRNPNA
ncbi:hypothetical protein F2Q70_00031074 [Brassica cretica]|uniref:Uncharacterized protein n=1 Tax=Brassica cretica TaxID=69181 RepID=A0A3N6RYC5_BRACR|nr:hypothetical protein F2Q70_00031074 [Brassica cretica]KAF3591021.1 hypothetical protein DY000_02023886 [Brassica cretica]